MNNPQTNATDSAEADQNLARIMQKLHDSTELHRDLAKRSNRSEIRQYADKQIVQRQIFDDELRSRLQDPHVQPVDGSIAGLLRRIAKDVRSVFPGAEAKMLVAVENGETSLRASYFEALQQNPGSTEVRDTLHRQQVYMSRAQTELRSLIERF